MIQHVFFVISFLIQGNMRERKIHLPLNILNKSKHNRILVVVFLCALNGNQEVIQI